MKSAIMIAATGSGCGKTTITCALLAAMKKNNLNTRAFKCGPDYIDPMFHKTIIGVPSTNLDLFFAKKDQVRELFYADNNSDISIVEGVMGLYDGMSSENTDGSSYDLACTLDIPIVLVVNAHGMGRSVLAVIRGFLDMDYEKRIRGVILNQVSPMYYETLKILIEKELQVRVFGYYPKLSDGIFESRYLGLKLPEEIEKLSELVQTAADRIMQTTDINGLLSLGAVPEALRNQYKETAKKNPEKTVRIGVARDEAFCFFYEENLRLLEKMGAELVFFSPLREEELPKNLDGLLFCGGYPELHASKLSENASMRASIKEAILSGMPSLAECGGFMYLHEEIVVDGEAYPMVGVVSGRCEKKDRLVRFGYLRMEEKKKEFLIGEESVVKGHEFHYYDSTNNGIDAICKKPSTGKSWEAAHINKNHWWGFAHLYYLSNPDLPDLFLRACRQWGGK